MSNSSFVVGKQTIYVKGDKDVMIQQLASKCDKLQQRMEILEANYKYINSLLEKEVEFLKSIISCLMLIGKFQ